jgi:hypothetical protein
MQQAGVEFIIETRDPDLIQTLRDAGARLRPSLTRTGFSPHPTGQYQGGMPGRMRGARPGFPTGMQGGMMGRSIGGGTAMEIGQFAIDLVRSDPVVHASAVVVSASAAIGTAAKAAGETAESIQKVIDVVKVIGDKWKNRGQPQGSEPIIRGGANLDPQQITALIQAAIQSGVSIKIEP